MHMNPSSGLIKNTYNTFGFFSALFTKAIFVILVVEAYHVGNEGIYENESVQKTIGKKKKMD